MADLIKLTNLLDEAKCYEVIRQLRWPEGVVCLHCSGRGVVRNGHDDRERHRQRYWCKTRASRDWGCWLQPALQSQSPTLLRNASNRWHPQSLDAPIDGRLDEGGRDDLA